MPELKIKKVEIVEIPIKNQLMELFQSFAKQQIGIPLTTFSFNGLMMSLELILKKIPDYMGKPNEGKG